MYYLASLGQDYSDEFEPEKLTDVVSELVGTLPSYLGKDGNKKFTIPDVMNPLVILLSSYKTVRSNQDRDLIVGVPSGGTEGAIVIQLLMEKIFNLHPKLALVPLSFHGGEKFPNANDTSLLTEYLQSAHPDFLKSKNVLMVDDNSNTGMTLNSLYLAITAMGIKHVGFSLMELDPTRLIAKFLYRSQDENSQDHIFFNMGHPDVSNSVGLVKFSQYGPSLNVLLKSRLSKWYQENPNPLAARRM